MPFNGSGTFSRLYSWVTDAANSVNISSSRTDAEMNGFAAGLTNCITRDGQSPPSADIPWGAKKLTNLANATVATDALNMATGDARYILASITALTLSGSLTAGGAITLSANSQNLSFTDMSGTHPHFVAQADNNLAFYTTDSTGANRLAWYMPMRDSTNPLTIAVGLSLASTLVVAGVATGLTPTVGDNSTKFATTAFVVASYAPLASPSLTGTPTAPTAAAGTATTQLATTAFVDALRDVPSNAKAANYALALTDRGGGVDFNGTSLACTIPANASVAFPVGATVVITNLNASNLSIAITTDTLTLAGSTSTGTRTLAQNGMATARKVTATSWLISGAGLT